MNTKEERGHNYHLERNLKLVLTELTLIWVLSSCGGAVDTNAIATQQADINARGAIATLQALGTEFPAPTPTITATPTMTSSPTPTATPFSGVEMYDNQGKVVRYPTYAAPSCEGFIGCPGNTRVEFVDGTPVPNSTTGTPSEWPWTLGGIALGGGLGIGIGVRVGVGALKEKSRYKSQINRRK